MSKSDIIRSWKDAAYRASLSAAERERLPENPAGVVELSEEELGLVFGGKPPSTRVCSMICSMIACSEPTFCV